MIKIEVFPVHAPCHPHTHRFSLVDAPSLSSFNQIYPPSPSPFKGAAWFPAATWARSHVPYQAAPKHTRANKTHPICLFFNSRFCLSGNDFGPETEAARALLIREVDKQKRTFPPLIPRLRHTFPHCLPKDGMSPGDIDWF